MICPNCGAQLADQTVHCNYCGQPTGINMSQPMPHMQQMPQQMPVQLQIPMDHKPISPMGYFGYNLLFAIPIVGLIMMFMYAFGSDTNVNVKNFARYYLIVYLISIVLVVIFYGSLFALMGALRTST